MSIRFTALLAVAASLFLAPASAEAGLFGCRSAASCCDAAPSCEVTCDPCARPRLLSGLKARFAAKSCCEVAPVCCDAAPVCCDAAPVACCEPAPVACCEPAPVACCNVAPCCGCEAAPCCCKKPRLLARLKSRLASRRCCAPSCGCEVVASSCGCGCN